jgi:hypothetical protein
MIMKTAFWISGLILIIITISNLPPIHLLYKEDNCRFSNSDGSYTYAEMLFEGDNFEDCKGRFAEFKKTRNGDSMLYRITPINPLHFWDYGDYLFTEKYRMPFRDWESIKEKRGLLKNKSGYQQF